MRETSSRSSTRREQVLHLPLDDRPLALQRLPAPRSFMSCSAVTIGASGLRSSWPSIARNSSLARLRLLGAAAAGHHLGDVGRHHHHALDPAVQLPQRLDHHVEEGLLGLPPGLRAIAARYAGEANGLARDTDLLDQLDGALARELGKRLAEGASEELPVSHHLRVALVGELEAQLGPGEDGDTHRRLAEDGPHSLGLTLLDDPELRAHQLGVHPGQQLARS